MKNSQRLFEQHKNESLQYRRQCREPRTTKLLLSALLAGFLFTQCTTSETDSSDMEMSEEMVEFGVGAKPVDGAEMYLDGTREMLDEKWVYWEGPRLTQELPIKWMSIADQDHEGEFIVNSNDPASKGGKYGTADIVTKKKFKDFRAHVEFFVVAPGGNSGVYLQNRYEIQILDGDSTTHGMAAVINEAAVPYSSYKGQGMWNAYDINFRAARFDADGNRTENPMVSMYFNGEKVHTNQAISKVWGGENSGLDGGNDDGNGITDTPGGLKLQAEGHDVLYRNIWIKDMNFETSDTDF